MTDRTNDVDEPRGTAPGAPAGGGNPDYGVTAAVERGPAELSDEGEPVRPTPHVALDDEPIPRSTDDL